MSIPRDKPPIKLVNPSKFLTLVTVTGIGQLALTSISFCQFLYHFQKPHALHNVTSSDELTFAEF